MNANEAKAFIVLSICLEGDQCRRFRTTTALGLRRYQMAMEGFVRWNPAIWIRKARRNVTPIGEQRRLLRILREMEREGDVVICRTGVETFYVALTEMGEHRASLLTGGPMPATAASFR